MKQIWICDYCAYRNENKDKVVEHEKIHAPCGHTEIDYKINTTSGSINLRVFCRKCNKTRTVRLNEATPAQLSMIFSVMDGEKL